MSKHLNENTLAEQPALDWLKELGYDYEWGPDLAPGGSLQERDSFQQVILVPRLKRSLRRLNTDISERELDLAVAKIAKYEHPNLILGNKELYAFLKNGFVVETNEKGSKPRKVKVFDFENVDDNEFLAVNQFAVQGVERLRRADIVVFVNGIPLALFELKNPTSGNAKTSMAYGQIQDYKKDIPDLFLHNQIIVIGDSQDARHGTISSPWEWFSAWKGIESEDEKHTKESPLEVLVKGMFGKERLLDIIRNFIVYEADNEKDATTYTKKMCMYHQYFGVNKAVKETLRAAGPKGDKKIGVFWHTQGSGKSLSMVFYVNKTKELPSLESPTFIFLTDRNDLDGQLYKTFLRGGYPTAKQAESVKDLKERLRNASGELIFTTIQKFETEKEILSENSNIIVIADEAHRSQYAKFAGNVREAIPNASFIGITGTPISTESADTQIVFGKYVSVYQIQKAVDDGATVPIYYESRYVPLKIADEKLLLEVESQIDLDDVEQAKPDIKRKYATIEQAVGAPERLKKIADDIISHFNAREIEGKAMVVTMSRRIAVNLYNLMKAIPGAPEMAVVISKTEDFKDKIQKDTDPKSLERCFKDPNDPLKIAIVCDMWLTGFDVPCLHTMYLDKLLKNHSLMQAIARVNRIYKDKPGGLIVDYIGIANNLKKALVIYSSDIRKEAMVPLDDIIEKMREKYDIVKAIFEGVAFEKWRELQGKELNRLFQEAINAVITNPRNDRPDEGREKRFMQESEQLFKLHALVMPHLAANKIRNDVAFFQAIKKIIAKRIIIDPGPNEGAIDSILRELVSKSIAAGGIIDIFAMREKGKPDISILDEKFLEEVKQMRFKNLAVETLRKLLNDEIRMRSRKNTVRYASLLELLEKIIEDYEKNIIDSSKVIERLVQLAREIKKVSTAGADVGLNEEEMAFYDSLKDGGIKTLKENEFKDMAKEIMKIVKRNLSVDWTQSEVARAKIRALVRLLLLRSNVSDDEIEPLLESILKQAIALYGDYVPD
jgi:type I restriction enzyme R subunit